MPGDVPPRRGFDRAVVLLGRALRWGRRRPRQAAYVALLARRVRITLRAERSRDAGA